jgi:hypothetical protein
MTMQVDHALYLVKPMCRGQAPSYLAVKTNPAIPPRQASRACRF